MDSSFYVAALEDALVRFGKPTIFNTDQGSQFSSAVFTGVLQSAGIKVSMDIRDRWIDNVFIELLWRSLKNEDVYLKGHADAGKARAGIADWFSFDNDRRPHQAFGSRNPMDVWHAGAGGAFEADRCTDSCQKPCPG